MRVLCGLCGWDRTVVGRGGLPCRTGLPLVMPNRVDKSGACWKKCWQHHSKISVFNISSRSEEREETRGSLRRTDTRGFLTIEKYGFI